MQVDNFPKELVLELIKLARVTYSETDEPIPQYHQEQIENVLACCNRIYSGYYESKNEMLVNLLYNLCKGHYLHNGNKRITFIMGYLFLVLEDVITFENLFRIEKKIFKIQEIIDFFAKNNEEKEKIVPLKIKEIEELKLF